MKSRSGQALLYVLVLLLILLTSMVIVIQWAGLERHHEDLTYRQVRLQILADGAQRYALQQLNEHQKPAPNHAYESDFGDGRITVKLYRADPHRPLYKLFIKTSLAQDGRTQRLLLWGMKTPRVLKIPSDQDLRLLQFKDHSANVSLSDPSPQLCYGENAHTVEGNTVANGDYIAIQIPQLTLRQPLHLNGAFILQGDLVLGSSLSAKEIIIDGHVSLEKDARIEADHIYLNEDQAVLWQTEAPDALQSGSIQSLTEPARMWYHVLDYDI